jgi:hypothetical protein
MRTIPALLAAAAIAVGPATMFTAPAHAGSNCDINLPPEVFKYCVTDGRMGSPGGAPPQAAPASQQPAAPPPAVADHPLPPPPVAVADHPLPPPPGVQPVHAAPPAGMSPGPESSWPGGVAADCANPAYAASYNFFCADVGIPGATPAGAPAVPAPPIPAGAPPQVAENEGSNGYPGLIPPEGAPYDNGYEDPTSGGGCNKARSKALGLPCTRTDGRPDPDDGDGVVAPQG